MIIIIIAKFLEMMLENFHLKGIKSINLLLLLEIKIVTDMDNKSFKKKGII